MTVSANDLRKSYTGNGVTKIFSGPLAHLSSQINVYVNGTLQGSGYTLTGVGGVTATTVTFTTAPSNGASVVIERSVTFDQQLDITNQSTVYPEQYERAFDALTFQTQQLADGQGNSVRFPAGYAGGASLILPAPPVALRAIRWNAAGNALEYFVPPAGTVTSVSASGSTGLSVSGSPITGSGALTFTLSANLQSWSGITPATKANVSSLGGAAYLEVGTTAGTVAAGNDSRFTDSREWTAATVTQAEAEAGTDTNRKAWSVLRVWQAIAAWWAASSAKSKLDGIAAGATVGADWNANVSNKPALGTAAAKNVPASGDAAAGEVVLGNDSRLSGGGGGSGTVTSVGLSLPSELSVSGSPVTTTGTLSATWASQTQAKVMASPASSTGTPSFRALAATDVPTLNQNTTGNAGTATALQTARTIDGQSFDGTVNITVIAPGTHAATSKATPVDADEIPLVDSAASNVLKRLTWANLKATVKTYFDTLYAAISHTHSLSNLTQSSATTNQVPQWNGSAWVPATVSGGGGGSPGGSDKQMQFNDAGAFGGCAVAYWDAANGRLSVGAGTSPAGKMHAKAGSASEIPMIAQGTTSQTGNLQEWRDSSGTVLSRVTAGGVLSVGMGSTGEAWVGSNGTPGAVSLRGDPASSGWYGLGYNSSLDATFLFGYNGRKVVIGTRNYDGTYNARFTFDDASGVQTWMHAEAINYVFGTTTGTKLGTAASQKLGFWGATAVVQPASANQAMVAGTAGGTYTSTEQTLISDLKTLVNQLRADLVTVGIIKGSA